jgi:SH3 domain-containing protein
MEGSNAMAIGQVTATSLNLRNQPDGTALGFLVKGTPVTIHRKQGKWLEVTTIGVAPPKSGWVSGDFINQSGGPTPPTTSGAA